MILASSIPRLQNLLAHVQLHSTASCPFVHALLPQPKPPHIAVRAQSSPHLFFSPRKVGQLLPASHSFCKLRVTVSSQELDRVGRHRRGAQKAWLRCKGIIRANVQIFERGSEALPLAGRREQPSHQNPTMDGSSLQVHFAASKLRYFSYIQFRCAGSHCYIVHS